MSLSTYTEFLSDIAGWLDKHNLGTRIADFISLAELRLNRELRVSWMTNSYSYTVLSSDGYEFDLPNDFNGFRIVRVTSNPTQRLSYMSPENVDEYNLVNGTDKSSYYSIIGNKLLVLPPPIEDDVITATYYKKATPLSPSNATNLFTVNAPDALLYAALLEAKPYVKDEARMKVWADLYTQAVINIETADRKIRWAETSLEPRSPYGSIESVSTG